MFLLIPCTLLARQNTAQLKSIPRYYIVKRLIRSLYTRFLSIPKRVLKRDKQLRLSQQNCKKSLFAVRRAYASVDLVKRGVRSRRFMETCTAGSVVLLQVKEAKNLPAPTPTSSVRLRIKKPPEPLHPSEQPGEGWHTA